MGKRSKINVTLAGNEARKIALEFQIISNGN